MWLRLLFGGMYFCAGASWFIPEFPRLGIDSLWFVDALAKSGLFTIVKLLELFLGACLLGNRFVPGAVACLMPISFVIAYNDVFIEHSIGFAAVGVSVALANVFLAAMYHEHFSPLLTWRPPARGLTGI